MPNNSIPEDREFKPEDAFLYAFDEAIEITANCLRAAGADEESIWRAFRKSLIFLIDSSADVDETRLSVSPSGVYPPGNGDYQSMIQLAHQRRHTSRRAASA